jgi:methylated-DNA-[protein]-cysteine S-methyltransferase
LTGVWFTPHRGAVVDPVRDAEARRDDAALASVVARFDAYFAGDRDAFDDDLALAPVGTPFQQRVWAALREIPYGSTRSYAAVARRIGNPDAVRAVGLANGRNPLSIVVPCHRVIGSNGALVGYGGGLERKRRLLELEGARIGRSTLSLLD